MASAVSDSWCRMVAVTKDNRGRSEAEAVEFPRLQRRHENQTTLFSRSPARAFICGGRVCERTPDGLGQRGRALARPSRVIESPTRPASGG